MKSNKERKILLYLEVIVNNKKKIICKVMKIPCNLIKLLIMIMKTRKVMKVLLKKILFLIKNPVNILLEIKKVTFKNWIFHIWKNMNEIYIYTYKYHIINNIIKLIC